MKFKKGISGNPKGRPSGTAKTQKLREAIAEHLPEILENLVAQAKGGDLTAAKLLLERCLPPLKSQVEPVAFSIASNDGLAGTGQAIIDSVSRGEIPADVGAQLISALASQAKIVEIDELVARIEKLEAKQ